MGTLGLTNRVENFKFVSAFSVRLFVSFAAIFKFNLIHFVRWALSADSR